MATSKFNNVLCTALDSPSPTTNYNLVCQYGIIYLGGAKSLYRRQCLEFDLYGLAFSGRPLRPTDTITAAQLDFNVVSITGTASISSTISRITQANWVSAEATWNKYNSGNNWTAPGGDVDVVTPASVVFTGPAGAGAFSITGLVNFGTDAISNRVGKVRFLIQLTSEADTGVDRFVTFSPNAGSDTRANFGSDGLAPALNVTYTAGDEPPIPGHPLTGLSPRIA